MNMMARITEGDVELRRLDPGCIRPWHGNPRNYGSLSQANCSELIESIAKEGGNRVPVIVRRVPGDNLYLELVAGARRHFAVSHLQRVDANIMILAQVMTLSIRKRFELRTSRTRSAKMSRQLSAVETTLGREILCTAASSAL